MSEETKNKPVTTIRVGKISIPIWENEGDEGKYYKAGNPELRYEKDGNWKTGKSYGSRDLVNLAKAALLADSEIIKRNFAAKGGAGDAEDAIVGETEF